MSAAIDVPADAAAPCNGGDGGLAEGVFGVVVLLASEWVGVGSGLAEISMRAETWGNRLLALLLQVCVFVCFCVGVVVGVACIYIARSDRRRWEFKAADWMLGLFLRRSDLFFSRWCFCRLRAL